MWKVLISWFPFHILNKRFIFIWNWMNIVWINIFVRRTNEIQAYNVAQKKVTVIFSINIIPFSLMFPHYSDGWFKLKLISWFPFKYQHLLNVNIKQTKMYKNIVKEPYLYSRCGKIPRKNIFFHVKKLVSTFI